jgi:superfamily II DNA or RNA helicase
MDVSDRDEIKNHCKESSDPYIIITNYQVFSTGMNIPNLDVVMLCDSMKSKITIAQTIGRGVRKSHGKKEVLILDCACDLKYGSEHLRKRRKLYESEGFKVFEKKISQNL